MHLSALHKEARSPAQPFPSTLLHLLFSSLLHFLPISPFRHASPHPLFLALSSTTPFPVPCPSLLIASHSFPFLISFPLLLSPSPPHSINPYSPPSLRSSPISGPKLHPLFSIKWEGQSGSPDLLRPVLPWGLCWGCTGRLP